MHCVLFYTTPFPFWKLYAAAPIPWVNTLCALALPTLVPAFMFASGFLLAQSCDTGNRTLPQLLLHRVKRLLLPWLGIVLFWLVPLYTLFDIPAFMRPAGTPLGEGYRLALQGLFTDHLWFLLALFWATLFWIIAQPALRGRPPLAGACTAAGVALLLLNYGQGIHWYGIWNTSNALVCFYCGMPAFRERQRLDAFLLQRPFLAGGTLAGFLLLLLPHAPGSPPVAWLVSALCSLAVYMLCLLCRAMHAPLRTFKPYAWFEDNSFRYYLFHMPTPLLVFMTLYPRLEMTPGGFILLNIGITLAVTTIVVMGSHLLQRWLGILPFLHSRICSAEKNSTVA